MGWTGSFHVEPSYEIKSSQRNLCRLGMGRYQWFRRWCRGTWIRMYQALIPGIPCGAWRRVCPDSLRSMLARSPWAPISDLEEYGPDLPQAKVVRR